MVPTVTDEYIVPTETEFVQTLYCIFSSLPSVSLQSPGVACGCISMCMIFCLLKVLFFFSSCVIIWHTLQNGAAAPADQSMSNERPRDL